MNVGCIPKKLMHQAAILGHSLEDATKFGWKMPENKQEHDWETMKNNIQVRRFTDYDSNNIVILSLILEELSSVFSKETKAVNILKSV